MEIRSREVNGWNIQEVILDDDVIVKVVTDIIDPEIRFVSLDENYINSGGYFQTDLNSWRKNVTYYENIFMIPPHMQSGVIRYIENGIRGGDFMDALLRGHLFDAYQFADETNIEAMRDWVSYLYSYAPANCYGSDENVDAWMSRGGLLN